MSSRVKFEDYRFEIRPLSKEEGGGFLVSFPDLPGCISDGETYEEAIANAKDAFAEWIAAHEEEGREIPAPNGEGKPAKFVLRLPRSLHERLGEAAAGDGTSVNTLVTMFVAEGLARRERPLHSPSAQQSHGLQSGSTLTAGTLRTYPQRLVGATSAMAKGATIALSSRSTMMHVTTGHLVGGTLVTQGILLEGERSAGSISASDDVVVVPMRRVHG